MQAQAGPHALLGTIISIGFFNWPLTSISLAVMLFITAISVKPLESMAEILIHSGLFTFRVIASVIVGLCVMPLYIPIYVHRTTLGDYGNAIGSGFVLIGGSVMSINAIINMIEIKEVVNRNRIMKIVKVIQMLCLLIATSWTLYTICSTDVSPKAKEELVTLVEIVNYFADIAPKIIVPLQMLFFFCLFVSPFCCMAIEVFRIINSIQR